MVRRIAIYIAAGLFFLGSAFPATAAPRIINGVDPGNGSFGYLVSIISTSTLGSSGAFQAQFCAGALTTATTVVTAAHCLVDPKTGARAQPSDILIGLGPDLDDPQLRLVRVASVTLHPQYELSTARFDVAVLTLAEPLAGVPTITPLRPTDEPTYTAPGTAAQIAGWGNTSTTGSAFPDRFRVGDVVIFPDDSCGGGQPYLVGSLRFSGYRPGEAFAQEMLCAAGVTSTGRVIDSCQGDSGGPLVVGDGVALRLVGVVSWGDTCASNYPGVYTRMTAVTGFLQEQQALSSLAPTVPPGISVTALHDALRVTFTPANDGSLVRTFAATAIAPDGRPAGRCFTQPRKDGLPAVCDIASLEDGVTYQVLAIAANDLGDSPATAPVLAVPEPVPDPGRITKAQVRRDRSIAFTVSAPSGNGTQITAHRVICRPVAGGAERSAQVTRGSAVVRNLKRGLQACVVRATNAVGSASTIPKDFRIR
jgi:secreted trypsin-like serine protease